MISSRMWFTAAGLFTLAAFAGGFLVAGSGHRVTERPAPEPRSSASISSRLE